MIFGSVINENLKDEIVVTVIATGFNEAEEIKPVSSRPSFGQTRPSSPTSTSGVKREVKREEHVEQQQQQQQQQPVRNSNQAEEAF